MSNLKRIYKALILVLAMHSSCDANGKRDSSESRLNEAAIWLIQEGIALSYEFGNERIFRSLVDRWRVQLDAEVEVDSERYISLFIIKSGGIYYDVQCLYRETRSDGIYEYWVVKISSKDWKDYSPRCLFYVSTSKTIEGVRTIVNSSDQFIGSSDIAVGEGLELPIDDLKFLYDLRAWSFPGSYVGSDLNRYAVIINDSQDFEKIELKE